MSDNKRDITLPMAYGGHKELLKECVRAYLNTATPSCLADAVREGISMYYAEQGTTLTTEDSALLCELRNGLFELAERLRAEEDK